MWKRFWDWLESLFTTPLKPIEEKKPAELSTPELKCLELLKVAKRDEGQKEIPGSKDNPRITEYFKATSYGEASDEVPWCAASVNWWIRAIGEKGTNSAAAKSFDKWGAPLKEPVKGCVVCIEHLDSNGKKNGRRHVALFERFSSDPRYIYVLGGNQGNQVCVKKYSVQEVNHYRIFKP